MQTLGAAYGLLRYPLLSQDFPVSAHFYVRGGKGCMSTCDVFSSSWKYKQKGRYIHTLIYFLISVWGAICFCMLCFEHLEVNVFRGEP